MVLQAFIDDSGEIDAPNGDPVFVLGGFMAEAKAWADFSNEWKTALEAHPRIAYFKMREAANLSVDGQFARRLGWNEESRDAKVSLLAEIVPKYAFCSIYCSIDKAAFTSHFRPLAVVNRNSVIDKPYALAFQHIIMAAAATFSFLEVKESCDFIFDEQGTIGQEAVDMWDGLVSICENAAKKGRTNFRPFMGQRPVFRDDKLILPLQAADLYAWQVRRWFVENRVLYMPPSKVMESIRRVGRHVSRHLGAKELRELRESLERRGSALLAHRSDIELIPYRGSKSEQKRERVKVRRGQVSSREKPAS